MRIFSGTACERVWLSAVMTPWRRNLDIRLGMVLDGGERRIAVAQPLTFKEEKNEGQEVAPFLSLGPDDWQTLMDEMWRAGVRPSSGAGTATEASATERHLADMRKLAFHALKIPRENT